MRRRIAVTASLFTVAALATGLLGRWFPAPLEGPAAGLIVASLGALLIILAPLGTGATEPIVERKGESREEPRLGREHTLPFPTMATAPTAQLESPDGAA